MTLHLSVPPVNRAAGNVAPMPAKGDPCPVCSCCDTWVVDDPADGFVLLCYTCVQESLTPGDDGYPEGW